MRRKTKTLEHPRYTIRGYINETHVWAAHYRDDKLKAGERDNWEVNGKPYDRKTHWKIKI